MSSSSATGYYGVMNNVTNSPLNWSSILNTHSSAGTHQLLYSKDGLYTRSKTGSPSTWSGWTEFLRARPTSELDGASADLNNLAGVSGFYYINANVTNAPTSYCMLLSVARTASGASATFQIAWKGANLYTRAYTGNPLAWTTWKSYS